MADFLLLTLLATEPQILANILATFVRKYLAKTFHHSPILSHRCHGITKKYFLFQILRERIHPHKSREGLIWNSDPGALLTRTGSYSDSLSDFPFKWPTCLASTTSSSSSPSSSPTSLRQTNGCETFSDRHTSTSLTFSNSSEQQFTAVIFTQTTTAPYIQLTSPIFKLVKNVAASKFVQQVRYLQCDQLGGYFVQHLAIYNYENLPQKHARVANVG